MWQLKLLRRSKLGKDGCVLVTLTVFNIKIECYFKYFVISFYLLRFY